MRKNLSLILIITLFLVGAAIVSYPFVSSWLNSEAQLEAIETYNEVVETLSKEEIEAEIARAEKYNESLYNNVILTDPFDETLLAETTEEYLSLLDVHLDGIMGYIEIESINVKLPIYHGTSSEVLKKGAGHLQGSSLPIGGAGTHSVISAHTGLPSAAMFDDLVDVEKGDVFVLTILGEKLAYQVDKIEVVLPDNVSSLGIDVNEDYVTLVTCTPYGVNTHRLLVRGTRVPYVTEEELVDIQEDEVSKLWLIILLSAIAIVLISIILIIRKMKKKKRAAQAALQNGTELHKKLPSDDGNTEGYKDE